MSNARPVPAAAVRTAYHEELNDGQRSALLSWAARCRSNPAVKQAHG